jgi:hypothetical protein
MEQGFQKVVLMGQSSNQTNQDWIGILYGTSEEFAGPGPGV